MLELTKDEAIRLAREHSWTEYTDEVTCGHRGCEDHRVEGRRMIHTYGSFGCDLPLDDVIERIEKAQRVGWVDHLLRHDLAILQENGRGLCLDIPRPREEVDATS